MRQISIPGRYNAKVEIAEIRQSEATGAYYLYLEFVTDDGGFTSKRLYLSEKAIEYSAKNLNEVFGFDGEFSTVEQQFVGAECRIVVAEAETADGKRYLEVRYINRISPRDNMASDLQRILRERGETIVDKKNRMKIARILGVSERTVYTLWKQLKNSAKGGCSE